MKVLIRELGTIHCEPLTATRPLQECWVAGQLFRDLQLAEIGSAGLEVDPVGDGGGSHEPDFHLAGNAWVAAHDWQRLAAATQPTVLVDSAAMPLAWCGDLNTEIADWENRLIAESGSMRITYPWDFLSLQEWLCANVEQSIEGSVSEQATIEGTLILGAGSRILPGVFIEGTVIVGAHCTIGPNAYLRGATSIGAGCHIGQAVEIKNSIIYPKTSIGHLSYCGDTIVGEGANFGAGTITANYRHDGLNHRSMVNDALVDTGRRKLGAVIGDDVHTAIHTSIYPGRKIWPGESTRPGEVVQRDLQTHLRD
jgi:acetyltransferase-like isoleucine patch superfamily enzyme